jgi:hypothetical protein
MSLIEAFGEGAAKQGVVCIPSATRLANLKSSLASAELTLTKRRCGDWMLWRPESRENATINKAWRGSTG